MEPSALIDRVGPHPATRLGLDLESAADRDAWLLAALLLSARAPEPDVLELLGGLRAQGLLEPSAVLEEPDALAAALASGPWKDSRALAGRLRRCADAIVARGGVDSVAANADGLESLGAGLVRLAPGLGSATALRFLRPLRRIWADAMDVPGTPAALAAARCLGWGSEESPQLRLPDDPEVAARDLEAALERLGSASCRSGRPGRCPLAAACPSLAG